MRRISDLPMEMKPREKALKMGISTLSNEELLALILCSGYKGKNVIELSRDILYEYQGFSGLANLHPETLCAIKGVSKAKALSLLASFEIAKRSLAEAPYMSLPDARSIYRHYSLKGALTEEELLFLAFDKTKKLRREKKLYSGDECSTFASQRGIIKEAVLSGFPYFAILHNHPSGKALPSCGEIEFTVKLKEKGKELGYSLLDHLIISKGGYFSFKENGLI